GRDRVRAGLSTDVQRVHGVPTARGLAGFAGDLRGGDLARALARDAARNVGHAGLEARPARIEAACATRMDEALDARVCGTFRSDRSTRVVRVFLTEPPPRDAGHAKAQDAHDCDSATPIHRSLLGWRRGARAARFRGSHSAHSRMAP